MRKFTTIIISLLLFAITLPAAASTATIEWQDGTPLLGERQGESSYRFDIVGQFVWVEVDGDITSVQVPANATSVTVNEGGVSFTVDEAPIEIGDPLTIEAPVVDDTDMVKAPVVDDTDMVREPVVEAEAKVEVEVASAPEAESVPVSIGNAGGVYLI